MVDDNASSLELLGRLLAQRSFQVDLAASGAEARRLLADRRGSGTGAYGLALVDWRMPGFDGVETTLRLKDEARMLPVVLMATALEREEEMQAARDAGVDGFLVKPVGESALLRAILEATGHQSPHAAEDRPGKVPDGASLDRIRGARILLVEDNAINQQVAAGLLEQMGMTVEIAGNGHIGVAKALAAPFDLVLMDVQMPELDGFEATRQIRRHPGFERLPIIAMTAHAMAGDREKSLAAGMFEHLTKPIEVERLMETLLRWIKPRPGEAAAAPPSGPGKPDGPVLPEVAGLDTRLGLRLVGGSQTLYLNLLRQFQIEHGGEAANVRVALAEARAKDAERMAHSVKGAAAVLGATTLSAASAELEVALREQLPEAPERLERFAQELDAICLPLGAHFA